MGELPGDGRLPERYGRDALTLLVRDPRCVFAFWELNETTRRADGGRGAELVLRVYDLTDTLESGSTASLSPAWNPGRARRFVDYVVDGADNWYVHTDAPGLVLAAELGFGSGDAFASCVRSNVVTTPRGAPCHETDAEWLTLDELYRRLALSSVGVASATLHAAR